LVLLLGKPSNIYHLGCLWKRSRAFWRWWRGISTSVERFTIYICIYIYICININKYICICICIGICICIYIYIMFGVFSGTFGNGKSMGNERWKILLPLKQIQGLHVHFVASNRTATNPPLCHHFLLSFCTTGPCGHQQKKYFQSKRLLSPDLKRSWFQLPPAGFLAGDCQVFTADESKSDPLQFDPLQN